MPNDTTDRPGSISLLSAITRMLDASVSAGAGLDNLITVLSLLCVLSITNRNQPAFQTAQVPPAPASNPLHKLLGDLTKGNDSGGGGFSPDTLMSLLPLLNSPQLKSKLNPSTIGTVLGLLNNLGGLGGGTSDKPEHGKEKPKEDPKAEPTKQPPQNTDQRNPPPVVQPHADSILHQPTTDSVQSSPDPADENNGEDPDGKNLGRYLNWKNNF